MEQQERLYVVREGWQLSEKAESELWLDYNNEKMLTWILQVF